MPASPPTVDAPKESLKRPSTVVVGGGLAGISAALELAQNGHQVQLVEVKSRLGGRTGSFTNPNSNTAEAIDYCQHVGMGCCHALKEFIDFFQQGDGWETHRELHFFSRDGYQKLRALPFLPAPLHLATWLLKWPRLTILDRFRIAKTLLRMKWIKNRVALDEQCALTWLKQQGQSETAIDHFWSTIVVSALGEELSHVSINFVLKVLQDGFLNGRNSFHLLVPLKPLDELFNLEARKKLEELGVVVTTGWQLAKVELASEAGGPTALHSRNLDTLISDNVVLAVPWHQLEQIDFTNKGTEREIEKPEFVRQARELKSSPITGIHTWWDRPWLDTPHATIIGQLCQWIFPGPLQKNISSKETYYQIVVSASRSLPRNEDELSEEIQNEIRQLFPKSQAATLLRLKVVTDPNSVFSVSPGADSLRPDAKTGNAGVYVAGDWTKTGWPATMEGAIRSGQLAAEEILRQEGYRPV